MKYEVLRVSKNNWSMSTGRMEILGCLGEYDTEEEACNRAAGQIDPMADWDIEVRTTTGIDIDIDAQCELIL